MIMTTRQQTWLENLDELINTVPDLYLPTPVAERIMDQLSVIQEEIVEQIELRSTDWEA